MHAPRQTPNPEIPDAPTNDPEVAARARAWRDDARRAAEAALADTPEEWMDAMIKRFLLETSKQLEAVEQTKAHTVPEQAQHARTLATLGRNFAGFAHMHAQRLTREQKVAMSDDELRDNCSPPTLCGRWGRQKAMEILKRMPRRELDRFEESWAFWARPEQRAPHGDWRIWLFLGGRGAGKTRAGAEWIADGVRANRMRRIALIGATHAGRAQRHDRRQLRIAGLRGGRAATSPPTRASCGRAAPSPHVLSAEEPDSIRGYQFDAAWCDEFGKWKDPQSALDMAQMALRLGEYPRMLITTTPRNIPALKALMAAPDATSRKAPPPPTPSISAPASMRPWSPASAARGWAARSSTPNLSRTMTRRCGSATGSRPRASPKRPRWRASSSPSIRRPASMATNAASSSPAAQTIAPISWPTVPKRARPRRAGRRRVMDAYEEFDADRIVAEANQGGDMVQAPC